MVAFGTQLLTILENQNVKRDGELSNEEKVMVGALTKAESRKKVLEEVLYETFILVSEVFKQQMIDITTSLKKA